MADTPIEEQQIQDPAATQTTENQPETDGDASSTSQQDITSRLTALEEQLTRERQKNELLEQSVKLQERFLATQRQSSEAQPSKPQADPGWTQELDVLDKALEPVFSKRLKGITDPITQSFNALRDDNDALRFETFLQRNNPEVLEDEDSFNKVMQQVNDIRQAARQRGMEITRTDAFVFNEGLQGTKNKITARKQKKGAVASQEGQRAAAVAAAQATSTTGEARPGVAAGIQAIREKANRGERLTDAERVKMRDYVANAEL